MLISLNSCAIGTIWSDFPEMTAAIMKMKLEKLKPKNVQKYLEKSFQ